MCKIRTSQKTPKGHLIVDFQQLGSTVQSTARMMLENNWLIWGDQMAIIAQTKEDIDRFRVDLQDEYLMHPFLGIRNKCPSLQQNGAAVMSLISVRCGIYMFCQTLLFLSPCACRQSRVQQLDQPCTSPLYSHFGIDHCFAMHCCGRRILHSLRKWLYIVRNVSPKLFAHVILQAMSFILFR